MELRPYESLTAKRAELAEAHRKAMARLDAMEGAHAVAVALMDDWRAAREGRTARIYVSDYALMITMVLAKGETFGDAAEIFANAEPAIRETFPAEWDAEWSDVEDTSREHEAQRQSILRASPPGCHYFDKGAAVWLIVCAPIGDGSACQVVKVGERQETVNTATYRMVPIFKAVCPGDPVPLAAE